ncbi:MAG: hypothetical protein GWN71_45515, partial [Gammaproteobacteria bacterium]|nr:hypothetical protein [Gemmatimonadota bacterium]NIU80536.1 hypothetical protein [Gammaproteobacteria bacterium]
SDVLRAQSDASLRTAGLAIARAHLEELRTRPPAELVSETAVQVNEGGEVDPN